MVNFGKQRLFKSREEAERFVDNRDELPQESRDRIKRVLFNKTRETVSPLEHEYIIALVPMLWKLRGE